MAAFVAVVVYLVLLQTPNLFAAKDEEWKSATATYSKETDGSIVTGTLLLRLKAHRIILVFKHGDGAFLGLQKL